MNITLSAVQTNNTVVTESGIYLSEITPSLDAVIVERVTFFTFIKETPEIDDHLLHKYRIRSRQGEATMGTGSGNTFKLCVAEFPRIRSIQGEKVKTKDLLLVLSFAPSDWRIPGDTGSSKITIEAIIQAALQELDSYVLSNMFNTAGETLSATDLRLKHIILRKKGYLESSFSMKGKYVFEPLQELPECIEDKIVEALEEASKHRPFMDGIHQLSLGRCLDAEPENLGRETWGFMWGEVWGSLAWKIDMYELIDNVDGTHVDGAHYEKFDTFYAEGRFLAEQTSWDAGIIPELINDFEAI